MPRLPAPTAPQPMIAAPAVVYTPTPQRRGTYGNVDPLSTTPATLEEWTTPEWLGWMTHEDPKVPWLPPRLKGRVEDFARRLKGGLSTLANYTLSKCMADPATTEITGPTITDPTNPDLDYSYCDSDRRHVVNVSVVWRTPTLTNAAMNAFLGDWPARQSCLS